VTTFFPVGDDKRRIILVAPTGAGKTIIAAAIIQAAIAPKSSEATDDF
jgi:superfamily II DNA or RNA helicase